MFDSCNQVRIPGVKIAFPWINNRNIDACNRFTPLQKILADGCHFNQNVKQIVEKQFKTLKLKEFYAADTPKIAGYMYQGIVTKN